MSTAGRAAVGGPDEPVAEERISDERASRLIEEFESESPTRQLGGGWRIVLGVLAAALAIYGLYWTQFSIVTQVYRASFLLLILILTFLLYPAMGGDYGRPSPRNLAIRLGIALALILLIVNWARDFESARNLAITAGVLLLFAIFPLLKSFLAGRTDLLVDLPVAAVGAVASGYVLYRATQTWAADTLGVAGGTWRVVAVAAVVVASAALFPVLRRTGEGRNRIAVYDLQLALLGACSLVYLIFNYQSALQRVTNPNPNELLFGAIAIALTLEATRRTTGWALPVVAIVFLFYARYGNRLPEWLDNWIGHRGYRPDRIIGQNFLTLEGLFGLPIDVAATFIVLFTVYGAVLEYSGAGKFFIDWSFAALGKSRGGTGPGRTVTAAGFLLGTVSGSGVATTVTLGSLAWPLLRRAGFQRDAAGGLLSAAGIGALLSPPTLGAAAFLIAEYLEVSYLQVLVYATIPTILYYLSCLLMMEADSRRMKTRPVEFESRPLRELTLKYGYHFSSLFVIVILMWRGQTAFMAVFWSIVVAFLLSFIQPETRLTSLWALGAAVAFAAVLALTGQRLSVAAFWGLMLAAAIATAIVLWRWLQRRPEAAATDRRWLQALEAGGKGVISIASTTATAGVIVSIVTLTGLGLKLSGIIVNLATNLSGATFGTGSQLFFTVLFAALAVWVLGLAVPVTASYIIAAVMIVPSFTQLGVPEPAAHMFIFYYAVLADVSPPTALAPFAASAITGGNPFRTTMMAWKYCLPAFLVPFMFTLSPEGTSLLLIGDWVTIVQTFITACVAVAALAIAFGGWFIRQAGPVERVLAGLGGLALLYADPRSDIAGIALLALATAVHLLLTRNAPQPSSAAAD
jgi:TRAP transporter 4TM/12TM fusion protein